MIFIVIAVVAVILYFVIRPYFLKYDNIVCFTGAIGSGKTLNATDTAIRLLKRQRSSVRMYNLFHRKHKRPLPMLYSNIPLRIGFREMSLQLTEEHLLMQRHIVPCSIVFIDEVDQFAHQLEYKNPNLVRASDGSGGAFDEFCRLFRQYTFGGYFVMTTQSTDNIVLTIRRRMGCFVNLMCNRSWGIPFIWPHLFHTTKCRNIMISEDVKTVVEDGNNESQYSTLFGFYSLRPRYDTHCFSGRYAGVPYKEEHEWQMFKTNRVLRCPWVPVESYIVTSDDDTRVEEIKESEKE